MAGWQGLPSVATTSSRTENARIDRILGPHRRELESRPWGGSRFIGGAQGQGHRAPSVEMFGAELARVEEPRGPGLGASEQGQQAF